MALSRILEDTSAVVVAGELAVLHEDGRCYLYTFDTPSERGLNDGDIAAIMVLERAWQNPRMVPWRIADAFIRAGVPARTFGAAAKLS